MSPIMKWFDRRFAFDFPVDIYPELIERLRGTPVRLEERVRGLPAALLTRRHDGAWSIQENAGHLLDLEPLVLRRLDDYEAGAQTLHAADLTNRKTEEARHNERPMAAMLAAFRRERTRTVERLEGWAPDRFARTALHPRLKTPMRVVDMLFFQAEHDDHHLARIGELVRLLRAPRIPPTAAAPGARARVADGLARIPGPMGERFTAMFRRGSLEVEVYAPRGHDPQKPHSRDEAYVVVAGQGTFVHGEVRERVGPGDFLFVPAGLVHRFEDFTDDLVVWVLFYGPEGGESPG